MPELLLELLSEEIPARMQARAAEDLKRLVCDGLKKDGLKFESLQTFITPRRLTLVVEGIPKKLAAKFEEKRGPSTGAPIQAIKGFMGSLPQGAMTERRMTEKGEFFFAVVQQNEQSTAQFMPFIVTEAVFNLGWPKSMRWNTSATTWVRPIQKILAIFDGKLINDVLQLGLKDKIPGLKYAMNNGEDAFPGELEIPFSNRTQGHRFLSPKPFKVKDFADYKEKLLATHVILDAAERAAVIEKQAEKLAQEAKLTLKDDPGLLAEVAGLVEWPVAHMGAIDTAFMDLPDEVLTTTMRHHQKYFALTDAKGSLAPRFIVVANTETSDRGKAVVAGNERVLRARLADAKFFWDQDRERRLEDRVRDLGGRVFHAKLGTMLDKAIRIEQLAGDLAGHCRADPDDAMAAARLAKADLSTGMVAEFPELQGVMGRYYAINDAEKPGIADAIAEHYSPQGPGDACPSAPLSITVALADKIDTLVGFWAVDEKPTGSKDPFALRRAALGVIRLIVENGLRLPLADAFAKAAANLDETLGGVSDGLDSAGLLAFFADRLKVHLKEKGVRHDHIDAVFALGGEDDLVRLLARVDALGAFLKSEDGGNLLVAYKRAANIVRIEEKNDAKTYNQDYASDLLSAPEEKALARHLDDAAKDAGDALAGEDFTAAMTAIARLRGPVDDFFDRVTVNTEEPELRENRLSLLSHIGRTLDQVADFSKIEGGDK